MEEFKASVLVVCTVSAGICIVENLVSGTGLKNQMKLLLRLIFAVVIVTPFIRGSFRLELPELDDFDAADYEYSQELYREELCSQMSESISRVLLEQLTAAGIGCSEIVTEVNISDENSIYISRVIVSTDNFEAAKAVIVNNLGSETEVVNGNF